MPIRKFTLAVLLFPLLASCGPTVAAQPPTPAPITLVPTWTPVLPTAIPTVTEYPTFTPVPAFSPMPTPTTDPLEVLGKRFQDSLFSPTGRWVAFRDPEKLRVVNTEDSTRVWTLPCELFEECSTVYPVRWLNGRTLFFGPAPKTGSAPEGISMLTALGRIDARSGKWEIVLPDSERHYDFSFSPDDEFLAYTQSSGADVDEPSVSVGIVSLGDQPRPQKLGTLESAYAGNIVWSPFKPRFVFVTMDPEKGSAVGYYDIATNYLKLAMDFTRADILISDWGRDNLVSLEVKDWDTQQRSYRALNPFTGELIGERITATPE